MFAVLFFSPPHFHSLIFFPTAGVVFFSPPPGGQDLHTSASSLNAPRRHRRPFFSQQPFAPRVNGKRLPSFSRSVDFNSGKKK